MCENSYLLLYIFFSLFSVSCFSLSLSFLLSHSFLCLCRFSVSLFSSFSGFSLSLSRFSLYLTYLSFVHLFLHYIDLSFQMLADSRPQCRCSRHSITYITDVEYEAYISEFAPRNQLQIIIIVSSLWVFIFFIGISHLYLLF